jgi:hypothetical protein
MRGPSLLCVTIDSIRLQAVAIFYINVTFSCRHHLNENKVLSELENSKIYIGKEGEPDSVVGITTGYGLEDRGV